MGKSAGGPQGSPGTSTVINQSQPPQAFLDAYTNLTQRAQNQSQAPLQQYGGPLVQGFAPQQNQAFGTVQNLQGAYAPYLNSAAQQFSNSTQNLWNSLPSFDTSAIPLNAFGALTAAQQYAAGAAQPIDVSPYTGMATQAGLSAGYNAPQYANYATTAASNANTAPYQNFITQAAAGLGASAPQYADFATSAATGINPAPYQNLATKPLVTQGYGALPEYLSPYTQNVTNSLKDIFNQQNATQLSQVRGNAAAQGALGGDREAVAEALTAQQQNLAQAPAFSQALQQGYQQAQQALAQQQGLQLNQGYQQGQLALGAGQLGTQAGTAAGQLGLGAGQLINQAASTQGQLGTDAGQLGISGAGLGVSAGIGAGQLLNQAATTQGNLGLGAAGATTQALNAQGQLGLGAGQLTGQMGQAEFNEYNQQQQAQLQAEQANSWLAQGAGFGLGNLGSSAQGLGLAGAGAEQGMGAIQQQLGQQQLNIPFEQFTQQQAFPYGQLNWLAPMVEGLGAGAGGTSASTSPGPSPISQVAGLGLTGLGTAGLLNQTGAFGSGGWLTGSGGLFGSAGGLAGLGAGAVSAAPPALDAFSSALLAAPFFSGGGRIGFQGGGAPVPSFPDPKLGLSAAIPNIGDLSYLQAPQPRGLGAGIPKPPAPSSQPSGLDPNEIFKDLNMAESMIKMGKQLTPTGEASGGSISPPGLSRGFHPRIAMPHLGQAPHLGATGIGLGTRYPQHLEDGGRPEFDVGGMTEPLTAATPLEGAPPNAQGLYQQYLNMSQERLQELAIQVPSTTAKGQLIQRALQAKRMSPEISAQPLTLDTGTMQGTGLAAGGRVGFQGGGPTFPGLSPGMANAQPPAGFFGGAPISFPNLSSPSTINFPRGPVSFPPESPAPMYQAPLGLYAPSLKPAQNPFAGMQRPSASLPTAAPMAGTTNLPQPQPYLPTAMPQSSGQWPRPFQYTPAIGGPTKQSSPINYQQAVAPTLDQGIFSSYGAYNPVGQGAFSPYGVGIGIPNAAVEQFSLPQLGRGFDRGGTPFAPALRMGRQEGGEASADIPPLTNSDFERLRKSGVDEATLANMREGQTATAPPERQMESGLSRPIPSQADLLTGAPSMTIPLGGGASPPALVSSATQPTYNQETSKFEDRPRPQGLSSGFSRDQQGLLTRNGQHPDIMLPGGIPGWQESPGKAQPRAVVPASDAGLAAPISKVSETPSAPAAPLPAGQAEDPYAKIIRQISEQVDHKSDTGQQIYSSPWMLPITMGAGMLASRSPFPGQALGEGLLTGTKFLGQQQAQLPQNELRRAQADVARMGLTLLPAQMEAVRAAQTSNAVPTGATAGSATAPPSATDAGFPAGDVAPNAFLASQRVGFKEELEKNPELKKRLAAIIDLENPQAGTAVAESLMNRMAMSGGTIASGIAGGPESFYGPLRRGEDAGRLQELEKDPQRLQARMQQIDQALAGSNLVRGHTDQGSRGDPNYEAGGAGVNIAGERFNDWAGHNGVAASAEWRRQQQAQALGEGSADQVITGTKPAVRTQVAQAGPSSMTDASGGVPGVVTSSAGLPLPASVGKDPRFTMLDQQYDQIGRQINQARAYLSSPAAALDPKQWMAMQGHLASLTENYTRILTSDPRMKGASAQLEAEGRLPSQLTEIWQRAAARVAATGGETKYQLGQYEVPLPGGSGAMTLQAPKSQILNGTAPGLQSPLDIQNLVPAGTKPATPDGKYDPSPDSLIPVAPPPGTTALKIEHSEAAKGKLAEDPKTLEKYRQAAQETPLQLVRLNQLDQLINDYKTGKGAPAAQGLASWAKYYGFGDLIPEKFDPSKGEEINKLATQLVFAQIKQIGGRVLVSEIQGLGQANPNISLTPEANHAIIQNLALEQNLAKDRFVNASSVFSKYKQLGDFDQRYIDNSPAKDIENNIRSKLGEHAGGPLSEYEGKIVTQGGVRYKISNGQAVEQP